MLLLAEFFRVVWLIMTFFVGTWFPVIGRTVFSETKEAEQALPVDFCNHCSCSKATDYPLKNQAACTRIQVGMGLTWK